MPQGTTPTRGPSRPCRRTMRRSLQRWHSSCSYQSIRAAASSQTVSLIGPGEVFGLAHWTKRAKAPRRASEAAASRQRVRRKGRDRPDKVTIATPASLGGNLLVTAQVQKLCVRQSADLLNGRRADDGQRLIHGVRERSAHRNVEPIAAGASAPRSCGGSASPRASSLVITAQGGL
jgi:hypothetical protein